MFTIRGWRSRPRGCRPSDVELGVLRAEVAHELFAPLTNAGHIELVCAGDAGRYRMNSGRSWRLRRTMAGASVESFGTCSKRR
jgi:hypothetical protein